MLIYSRKDKDEKITSEVKYINDRFLLTTFSPQKTIIIHLIIVEQNDNFFKKINKMLAEITTLYDLNARMKNEIIPGIRGNTQQKRWNAYLILHPEWIPNQQHILPSQARTENNLRKYEKAKVNNRICFDEDKYPSLKNHRR